MSHAVPDTPITQTPLTETPAPSPAETLTANGTPSLACPDYVASTRWSGGHWMTLYTWARRREFPRLPPPDTRYFDVAAETRVLAECFWQPSRAECPTVLGLHGLEASSRAHYMRGLADKAFRQGFNVVLLNQRNCAGTEHLSAGLYHSGLTHDANTVIRELIAVDRLQVIAIVGYSLGGNLALKLAGEYGDSGPREVVAFCAVSPTMDLGRCVRALEERSNVIYQWNFVRNLRRRMRRKAALFPGRYDVRALGRVWTVRAFDEAYTAPHFGFRDADEYYTRASALRVIERVRVPTLVIASDNDPFVPADQFRCAAITGNPHITLTITRDGGHCAFVAEAPVGYDGYWAEQRALAFVMGVLRAAESCS
jgi:predicted alpha/beta-fold hydrolase